MAGYDRRINPITKDYVDNGRGGFETTRTLETAVYHQLQGHLNKWVGDPAAGCAAFGVVRKGARSVLHQLQDVYTAALLPFVKSGRGADLVVAIDRTQTGALAIRSSMRDIQGRGTLNIDPLLPFGA